MERKTIERHKHLKSVFCSIGSVNSLCQVLKIDKRRLMLMAQQPRYKTFTIPKKNGGERIVETPVGPQNDYDIILQ